MNLEELYNKKQKLVEENRQLREAVKKRTRKTDQWKTQIQKNVSLLATVDTQILELERIDEHGTYSDW